MSVNVPTGLTGESPEPESASAGAAAGASARCVAIVHANDGSDVRVGKTCRSLVRLGFEVHYIGWDRRPDAAKSIDLGGAQTHLLVRGTSHGKATVSGHAAFWAHVVRVLAAVRPHTVGAVNEDQAFLLLPLKGILYRRLVVDVFDALADRHSHRSWPLRLALAGVATLSRRGADRLVATDAARWERFGRFRGKSVVIENVPEDPGEALALRMPSGPVKVWAAGTLNEARGLRQLLAAIETLPEVRVVSAGWPYDRYAAETFLRHPRVDFRGTVTAAEALALAAGCDAVFSYYAPTSVNNRHASPNKVYDAMAIGRPVIINGEVHLAKWVAGEGVGEVCAYEDIDCLRRTLESLAARRAELPAFAARTRRIYAERYQWELMEKRLEGLYREPAEIEA